MRFQLKRFVSGILIGGLIGFVLWGVVTLIGIWKGATVPAIVGAGVGLLTTVALWLVPKPQELGRYLAAFWETWKMPPSDRVLLAKLADVLREQRQRPHEHIYLVNDVVDIELGQNRSRNTGVVHFSLVSCLLEDTAIERCHVKVSSSGYSPPSRTEIFDLRNVRGLTSSSESSRTIEITDARLMELVEAARQGDRGHRFHIQVFFTINGKTEAVKRLE